MHTSSHLHDVSDHVHYSSAHCERLALRRMAGSVWQMCRLHVVCIKRAVARHLMAVVMSLMAVVLGIAICKLCVAIRKLCVAMLCVVMLCLAVPRVVKLCVAIRKLCVAMLCVPMHILHMAVFMRCGWQLWNA